MEQLAARAKQRQSGEQMTILTENYGDYVLIENCVVGRNLNLWQIRGFANMAVLADVSSADVYDQEDNPLGTQRDLKPKHAKEASEYAVESINAEPNLDPRSFPEVILNARNTNAVSVLVEGAEIDFDSCDDFGREPFIASIRVNVAEIEIPYATTEPDISRVDGNHRLSRVPKVGEREMDDEYPTVAFALFVGLNNSQERKLFADINGKQVIMNTSHLNQIMISAGGDALAIDPKTRPLWFAKKLGQGAGVMADVVFTGGAKGGVKAKHGYVPPLNLSTLKSMVERTLKGIDAHVIELLPPKLVEDAKAGNAQATKDLLEGAEFLAGLLTKFWKAVKTAYPEAWQDTNKKKYILFQSIGSLALSSFAALVIEDLIRERKTDQESFNDAVESLRHGGITLEKSDYEGYAGQTGTRKVFEALVSAKSEGEKGIRGLFLKQSSGDSQLGS
jgi:DGQHR domain-containing protein